MRLLKHIPVIALLMIGITGCGLSEFEKRMDQQRKRVKEFDETNKLLDDPVEMPALQIQTGAAKIDPKAEAKPEVKEGWPFDIYLRLPKGFGSKVYEKSPSPYGHNSFPCFRYSGGDTGYNFFVVAAKLPEPDKKENLGEYTPKKFRNSVQQGIEEFLLQSYNVNYRLDKLPVQKVGIKEFSPLTALPEDVDKKIAYEQVTFAGAKNPANKEPVVFQAYFHEEGPRQICIVVHRPLRLVNPDAFNKSMEACLGSLDMTLEAAGRRTQFLKAKR